MTFSNHCRSFFIYFLTWALAFQPYIINAEGSDDEMGEANAPPKQLFMLYAFDDQDADSYNPLEDYVVKLSHHLQRKGIDAFTAVERGGSENIHRFFDRHADEKWLMEPDHYIALCFSRRLKEKYLGNVPCHKKEPVVNQEITCVESLMQERLCADKIIFLFLDGDDKNSVPGKLKGYVFIDFRVNGERAEPEHRNYRSGVRRILQALRMEEPAEETTSSQPTSHRTKRKASATTADASHDERALAHRTKRVECSPAMQEALTLFGPCGVLQAELGEAIFALREHIGRQVDPFPNVQCILCYPTGIDACLLDRLRHNFHIGGITTEGVEIDAPVKSEGFQGTLQQAHMVVILWNDVLQRAYERDNIKLEARDTASTDSLPPLSRRMQQITDVARQAPSRSFLQILNLDDVTADDVFPSSVAQHRKYQTPQEQYGETFELVKAGLFIRYEGPKPRKVGKEIREYIETSIDELKEDFEDRLEMRKRKEDYKKLVQGLINKAIKHSNAYRDPDDMRDKFWTKQREPLILQLYGIKKTERKQARKKKEELRNAFSTDPWKAALFFKGLGLKLEALKLYDLAEEAYNKGIQLLELTSRRPVKELTSGSAVKKASAFCEGSLGRLYYKQVVEDDKSLNDGHFVRENYETAFGHFKKALELNPQDGYAAYYLARLFMDGHIKEAKRGQLPAGLQQNTALLQRAQEATTDYEGALREYILHEKVREHAKALLEKEKQRAHTTAASSSNN